MNFKYSQTPLKISVHTFPNIFSDCDRIFRSALA